MTDQEFSVLWKTWDNALCTEPMDSNTLVGQITNLVWDIGVFKAIQCSWEKMGRKESDELKINPIVYEFIVTNFFKSFCIAIRKLTEDGKLTCSEEKNDRSIISIHSLLKDIKKHRKEYSRRRLFSLKNLEYDIEILNKKHDEYLENQRRIGIKFGPIPKDFSPYESFSLHKQWDEITSTTPDTRTENDVISEDYLDDLIGRTKEIYLEVKYLTNKYFAHASTKNSRAAMDIKKENLNFEKLIKTTIECGKLINSISNILSNARWPFLSDAPYDKWTYWSYGWNASEEELENVWQTWGKETEMLEPILPIHN